MVGCLHKKEGLPDKWWRVESPAVIHQHSPDEQEGGLKQNWDIRPNALQTFQEEGLISATHY